MRQTVIFDSSFLLRSVLAIGSSLLILAFLFHLVARSGDEVNLTSLVGVIRNTAPTALLIYLLLQLVGTLLRALRYRLLLLAGGEKHVPPLLTLYWITMVRNMAVDLFPARLGELVYVAMLNRISGTRVTTALTSLLFSTLLDTAVILPVVLALAVWFVSGEAMRQHLFVGGLFLAAALVFFVFGLTRILPPFARWVQDRFGDVKVLGKLSRFLRDLTTAINQTLSQGIFGQAVLLTVGLRLTKYSALYILFTGVVLPSFPPLGTVDPASVVGMLIAAEAGASLPVPAFMSFGSWEAGGLAALTAFGFSAQQSILALLALHINSQIIDYFLGALALGMVLVAVKRGKGRRAAAGHQAWRVAMVGAVMASGIAALVFGIREFVQAQHDTPPLAGMARAGSTNNEATGSAWLNGLRGYIAWSSNRSGNHDIMMMELPGKEIRRLTTHPHTETYPRFSPDGRQLVFVRSHKTWQSMRNPVPWDVHLLDLETGEERLLAKNGMWPTWSEDGRFVYFQRNVTKLIRHEIASGNEDVVFEAGRDGIPRKTEIQTPSIHPENGKLAVTLRRGARKISIVSPNTPIQHLRGGDACQLTWAPSGKFSFHVGHGGRQTNAIYITRRGGREHEKLLDMPGEFSHEYFPRLSRDERYLLFGASAGGHEHDTADYEVFLWRIGSDPASTARLTFHSGNDNWPDIYLIDQ